MIIIVIGVVLFHLRWLLVLLRDNRIDDFALIAIHILHIVLLADVENLFNLLLRQASVILLDTIALVNRLQVDGLTELSENQRTLDEARLVCAENVASPLLVEGRVVAYHVFGLSIVER